MSAVPVARAEVLGPPAQWHRVLTLLADVSLFIGTRSVWTQAATHNLVLTAAISVCYASILVTGVLALTVRRTRSLARLDLVVLVTAIVLTLCAWALNHAGGDEAVLTTQAAKEIVGGHQVYDQPWPWLFHIKGVALTATTTGGYDYTYGYPPLAPLVTAPFLWLGHTGAPATLAVTVVLIVGAAVLWRMLPTPWRSAATMVCLGFGFLPMYARQGYPAIVGLVLLVPVTVRWPRFGAGGRLGPAGVARAACIGAACAAQQLPWFVTPFLLAGIYAVRRGELGGREAARVVLRIAAIAVGTWLLINAYFVVSEPGPWLRGIALPLTQGAVLHGQGLVDISLYFTHGSDRLDWYGHASMLLAAALLALYVLFVRRLGPAATVLPWCAFYLATRSQDGYYLMYTPLWLAAAITVPLSEFRNAWQPRPRWLTGPRRRPALVGAVVLLIMPALASAALAVTGRPPLRMDITAVRNGSARTLSAMTVRVVNTGGDALTPHYMLTTGQGMNRYWSLAHGPATIPAHGTATVELRAPKGGFPLPVKKYTHIRLRAFTATPQTLSTKDVRRAELGLKG
ncbi:MULTISPECIES: membrane protein [Streptomyces]|uniref:membrane protein n=1 Tax=Streptomyces TaxID=1883 RepID=UPI0005600206|nr:membrane protein [Streptomyces durhamensis]